MPLAAQGADLAAMRARDRLGLPAEELAAWQAFATPVLADPQTPDRIRAETLLGLAIARYYARDYQQGWADIRAAEAALGQDGAPFLAELLAYGAMLALAVEDKAAARSYADRALAVADAMGPGAERAQALARNAQGSLAFAEGDLASAEVAFCGARDLGLAAGVPDHPMIVNDASSCAAVKYYLERPDTIAAVRLARDHALAHLPPDHTRMGNVLNTGYGVLMRYGRYAEALPMIRRHLELERSLRGPDDPYVYDALSMLGRALELLDRLPEGQAIFTAAADLAGRMDTTGYAFIPGIARTNLGRVVARQGRLAQAEAIAREGLERLRADLAADDFNIGSGQVQLADHLSRLGRAEEALALVESGLELLEAGLPEGHSEILTGRLIRARVLSDLGRHAEALEQSSAASARLTQGLFDIAASEADLVSLSQVLPEALGDHLLVALRAGDMDAAVQAVQLQLTSELALTNAHIRAGSRLRQQGLGAGLDRAESAQAQVAALERQLRALQVGEAQGDGAALAAQLAEARAEAQEARAALARDYPDFLALARPDPAPLAALQAWLHEDELLVLPLALADRVVSVLVARDAVTWNETAMPGYAARQLAARLRASAQAIGQFDTGAAHQIYAMLFPPQSQPLLAAKRHLLFPASGYLARFSPAMLLAEDFEGENLAEAPWLARSHAVEVLADIGSLRARARSGPRGGFLGIGAPAAINPALADIDLPPLPRAPAELAALARVLTGALGDAPGSGREVILTGAAATERNLAAQDLPGFGVIAFATHGLLGGEVPGLSEPALLLTPDGARGEGGDGLLTASEIATLSLDADWVILSACETAAGASSGAPGYSGLARAFAAAGARSLMLSHWRVRDDAAAMLSVETVRGAAAGLPRAEALRRAQLGLMARADIADAAHPAIWAPFVIVGN